MDIEANVVGQIMTQLSQPEIGNKGNREAGKAAVE